MAWSWDWGLGLGLATLSRTYELNANFLSCLLGAARRRGCVCVHDARLEKYVIGSWQS